MEDARARALLEAERERLLALRDGHTSQHLEQSLEDSTSELSAFDQHPADIASETVEREKDYSVREHVEAQLREVDDAFRRLEDGRYGICEATGEPIPDERLEAEPAARYTVDHQRRLERGEVGT
ncbi:MAG TPA: TraR/DksA C4-type zinc finger protein [Egibacteraceae bacterium]|nr:TraR/DksA C4-type zinc finger protein [Egibacteraceae bacterium]